MELENQKIENAEAKTKGTTDAKCANIANRLMEAKQNAISAQNESLNELMTILEQDNREDIESFIEEIKDLILGDETEHWDVLKEWFEFFSGIEKKEDENETEEGEELYEYEE